MKNYTKALAEQIVAVMDRYNNYEELEKIVICYGMELFLNSILKISIYFVIGFSIGKGVETILSIIIFGSLRKVSGGRHAKTDVGCFIMTGSIIFLAVMSPDVVNVSIKVYALIILFMNGIFICLSPCDEYFESLENNNEKMIVKWESVLMINIIFTIGIFINNYWRTIIFMVIVAQGITLIGGKEHEKKNYKSSKTRIFYYMLYYKYHYCFLPLDYCR